MVANQKLHLEVMGWAAILNQGQDSEELGDVAPATEIPAPLRRRCPPFVRESLRCGLPILRRAPSSDLVFCSCDGDLAATAQLLEDIHTRTPLSPAQFSLSVHNAAAGLLGQVFGQPINHTAIAAGPLSLSAGLMDAYARLVSGTAGSIVLIYADAALPEIYQSLDEPGPDVYLAMWLVPTKQYSPPHCVAGQRQGGVALARALDAGMRCLEFSPPSQRERMP